MLMFLTDSDLSEKISEICGGEDLSIAVAYWGDGAPARLSLGAMGAARILCDISSGSTNPVALTALGAPTNPNLRHKPGLHAKVYISSLGCIVCSANASESGIGKQPRNIEAGIFCDIGGEVELSARRWFDGQWNGAEKLDAPALDLCKRNWCRAAASRAIKARERQEQRVSLPELLQYNPEVFGGIHFLLTNEPIAPDLLNRAIKMNRNEFPDNNTGIYCYFGWEDGEEDEIPSRFVNIHRDPRGGYWVSFLTPGFLRRNIGVYCAVPHNIRQAIFCELDDVLEIGQYMNWPEGGGGYRLGKGAFEQDAFDRAVDEFHTAEMLSNILFP